VTREVSRIELRDGSVISGEVVGFADGRYLVESPALGRVTIDQSQIRSLQPGGAAAGGPQGYGPQITALQRQMMGDAEIMGMITALQSNPRFNALMSSLALRALQGRLTGQ
jgi:hypothetical protein